MSSGGWLEVKLDAFLAKCIVGGQWSPYGNLSEAERAELCSQYEMCKKCKRNSPERGLAILQVHVALRNRVRYLLGCHDGGSISPYDVCKTVKEVCARSRVSNPHLARTARSHAPLPPIHLPSPTDLS